MDLVRRSVLAVSAAHDRAGLRIDRRDDAARARVVHHRAADAHAEHRKQDLRTVFLPKRHDADRVDRLRVIGRHLSRLPDAFLHDAVSQTEHPVKHLLGCPRLVRVDLVDSLALRPAQNLDHVVQMGSAEREKGLPVRFALDLDHLPPVERTEQLIRLIFVRQLHPDRFRGQIADLPPLVVADERLSLLHRPLRQMEQKVLLREEPIDHRAGVDLLEQAGVRRLVHGFRYESLYHPRNRRECASVNGVCRLHDRLPHERMVLCQPAHRIFPVLPHLSCPLSAVIVR